MNKLKNFLIFRVIRVERKPIYELTEMLLAALKNLPHILQEFDSTNSAFICQIKEVELKEGTILNQHFYSPDYCEISE